MNAGVSEFVRTRLSRGSQARSANGVGAKEDSLRLSVAPGSGVVVADLPPFRLLAWMEGRKKRPAEGQEPFDAEAVRAKIRGYLVHADWRIRNVGVKLVGLTSYREMLPTLLAMLRDRTPDTFLRRLFGGDFRQVGFIRRNILKAVGDLDLYDPEVRAALIGGLKDPYYEVRSCAAATVRRLSGRVEADPEVVEVLLGCLKDRSFEVVMEATLALGKVGGEGVTGAVLDLYAHRNWRVREAALQTTCDLIERGALCAPGVVERALDSLLIPCPSFKPNFPLRGTLRDLAQALNRLKGR